MPPPSKVAKKIVDSEPVKAEVEVDEDFEKRDEESESNEPVGDDFEAALLAGGKDFTATLDKLEKAKPEELDDTGEDFVKFVDEGQQLKGIYVGSARQPKGQKMWFHGVVCKSEDGKRMVVKRFLGTTTLTKKIRQLVKGTPVVITYTGKNGRTKLFEVAILKT